VIVCIFQFLNNMYLLPDIFFDISSHGVFFNENKIVLSDSVLTCVLSTVCLGL
jgi:hypothetical protein